MFPLSSPTALSLYAPLPSFGAGRKKAKSTEASPAERLQTELLNLVEQLLQAEPFLRQCHALSETQPDTFQQYAIGSNPPVRFSKPREALHQQILQNQLTPYEGRRQAHPTPLPPVAHIVTGLPGSGKSSVVVSQLAQTHPQAFVLDMDELAKDLPEYHVPVPFSQYQLNQRNGLGAKATHREAQYLARQIFNRLTTQGHPLIMSYVGDKVEAETSLLQELKTQGYATFLHHVQVSPQVAIQRVLQRFKETGRYVSPFYVAQLGNQSTEAFHQLIRPTGDQKLVQSHTLIHNEASPEEAPQNKGL